MSSLGNIYVPPEFPDRELLFCAEAPGETEERNGRPLVGLAGQLFEEITNSLGLYRGQHYGCTNVSKYRPTRNDWAGLPTSIKRQQEEDIRSELETYNAISTIICLGATATHALTTMRDPLGNPLSFTKMRGCFWNSVVINPRTGRPYKVMVTHHPSACLRQAASPIELKEDIQKVLKYRDQDILVYDKTPGDEYLLEDPQAMLSWIPFLMEKPLLIYDVESFKKDGWYSFVDCISFAWSPTEGVCFDLISGSKRAIGYKLEPLMMRPTTWYAGQNVTYDQAAMEASFGYYPNGIHVDTLDMHNLLDPGRPHNLGYINSKANNRPYYKDEDKHVDRKVHNRKDRLRYNLQDVLSTFGAIEWMVPLLQERGLWSQ